MNNIKIISFCDHPYNRFPMDPSRECPRILGRRNGTSSRRFPQPPLHAAITRQDRENNPPGGWIPELVVMGGGAVYRRPAKGR